MSLLKKLASQTAIYGLSSIFGRFLNYLLVPLYTYYFTASEYGVVSEFYAYSGFFSVFLLLGFETGYFRFRDKTTPATDKAYSTALLFVLLINVGFLSLLLAVNQSLAAALHYAQHAEYVLYFAVILAFDALAALPFAKLRAENKALRFASIKIIEILSAVALSLFFIIVCPKYIAHYPQLALIYNPAIGVGYIFIANLAASGVKFLLLAPQLRGVLGGFDVALFKRMLAYSLPIVVIGFAGVINEMLDRALLKYLLPYDAQTNLRQLGIYGACYKLSVLMSLFIQAFRYAAEPFFFAYAGNSDAKKVYAQILNFFVLFCVFIFLMVTLFLDFFQYFIGKEFREGLPVVPILLLANLCLGIYVNLSIWYKLTDRTGLGAWVSLLGATLTIALNIVWIPHFGYLGSAYATLICYAVMAVLSYFLGQHYYPVAYNMTRVLLVIALGLALYAAQQPLQHALQWSWWYVATALLSVYLLFAALLCWSDTRKYDLRNSSD